MRMATIVAYSALRGSGRRALEVGAGTGKATLAFAARREQLLATLRAAFSDVIPLAVHTVLYLAHRSRTDAAGP
jgi:hypothetical protein